MKILAFDARDVPPVKRFSLDDMSDLVVIAGANGVGKTRLIDGLLASLKKPSPDDVIFFSLNTT